MLNIKFKKLTTTIMLISFLTSFTPVFAINSNSTNNNKNDSTQSINLTGEVNLKKGNQLISVSLRESDVKHIDCLLTAFSCLFK